MYECAGSKGLLLNVRIHIGHVLGEVLLIEVVYRRRGLCWPMGIGLGRERGVIMFSPAVGVCRSPAWLWKMAPIPPEFGV